MTGAEFAALSDEEAARQVDDIGVIARVAPEHKVRLVEVLKAKRQRRRDDRRRGQRRAGHRRGRHRHRHGHHRHRRRQGRRQDDPGRRQLRHHRGRGRGRPRRSTTTCRSSCGSRSPTSSCSSSRSSGSTAFQIAGTALLIPSQVLWIHMAVVAPIGAVMGLDVATPGHHAAQAAAVQPGRSSSRSMMVRLFVAGLFMAAATLVLVQIGKTTYDSLAGGADHGAGRPGADEHLPRAQPALPRGQRVRTRDACPTRSCSGRSRGPSSARCSSRRCASCRTCSTRVPLTGNQWAHLPGARGRPAGPRRALQGHPAGRGGSMRSRPSKASRRIGRVSRPSGRRSAPRYRAAARTPLPPRPRRVPRARDGARVGPSPSPPRVATSRRPRPRPGRAPGQTREVQSAPRRSASGTRSSRSAPWRRK